MHDIGHAFEKQKAAALTKWRGWAEELAKGGNAPPMAEVVEAAGLLGIDHAARELERDAAAILQVKHLEQEVEITRRAIGDRTAADGGPAGVRERLTAARAEVRRLEALVGTSPLHHRMANMMQEANTLRRTRTRVFPPAAKQTKRPTTAGRKPARKAVPA